jgi:hypothetical protein
LRPPKMSPLFSGRLTSYDDFLKISPPTQALSN